MKARNLFRPLKVPAVWLAIFAFATFGLAVWWFTVVEPTVNYQLAWEQNWQWLFTLGCIAGVAFAIASLEYSDGYLSIKPSRLILIIALAISGTWSFIKWTAIAPTVNVANFLKVIAGVALAALAILLIGLTLYQVYQEQRHKMFVPKAES